MEPEQFAYTPLLVASKMRDQKLDARLPFKVKDLYNSLQGWQTSPYSADYPEWCTDARSSLEDYNSTFSALQGDIAGTPIEIQKDLIPGLNQAQRLLNAFGAMWEENCSSRVPESPVPDENCYR
jgi:hypothetical protein